MPAQHFSQQTTASQYQASSVESENTRLLNTTVCVPIVYGSIAFFLGKKADEYATHQWTLYVRGPNDEDLSCAISKVIFHLHPSFPQPVRELTKPPFVVTEKGWGEFEAQIRVIWQDGSSTGTTKAGGGAPKTSIRERPLVLTHLIRLYPPGLPAPPPGSSNALSTKEPVDTCTYDEVVFTNPTIGFYRRLQRSISGVLPKIIISDKLVRESWKTKWSDEDEFKNLISSHAFIKDELKKVKERIMKADEELEEITEEEVAASAISRSNGSYDKSIYFGSGGIKGGSQSASGTNTSGSTSGRAASGSGKKRSSTGGGSTGSSKKSKADALSKK
mmetsp:Transcript_23848/g.27478  ORF Transcript_23848/g.27478 Transcript_23848/m.27478 type:complete len:332 (-) Transcript_23848:200-1195(-)